MKCVLHRILIWFGENWDALVICVLLMATIWMGYVVKTGDFPEWLINFMGGR